jgi:L-glyceraldehyde 3-phosphate reductase
MSTYTPAEDRYESMPYRRCGRSGLRLPALSLGFWQAIGEPGNEDLCRQCCYTALDCGVTHFDLANNYGPPPGNSERVVGSILKDMPRDELIISTKAGYYMWPGPYGEWGSKKYLVASLDQSLQRLGLDYVDIFYHHRPDPDTPLDETLGALDLIVKQGKALYVGVSNYGGKRLVEAVETIARHDWTPIAIHQPYYNMLGRKVGWDLLGHTDAHGIGVIPFSPLAGGMLTEKYLDGVPDDSRLGRRGDRGRQHWEKNKQAGVLDVVGQLADLAHKAGRSLPELAIQWLLADGRITSVLVGVSRLEQLKQNIAAASADPLSADTLAEIARILQPGLEWMDVD